ncbi:hypothetical protein EDD86DRAFT_198427 [Gorgonomyces haynaldii]|nr:hypothetical protein EDD86DRAFT_198427 [Gorgonomyces haynaldii]
MLNLVFPMADHTDDQKYSREILYTHGVFKGLQVGSVLGFTFGSVWSLARSRPYWQTVGRSTTGAMLLGAIAVPGMIYGKMQTEEEYGWVDRAYRLQRNVGQNQSDSWTVLGLGGGLIAGQLLSMISVPGLRVRMASFGCLGSIVGYASYKLYLQQQK